MTTVVSPPEMYCSSCGHSYAGLDRCPRDGSTLVRLVTADPLIGRQLGGFTVKARLGAGGMGVVYRALQHSVGREVALKVINPALSADSNLAKRFLREARLAASISSSSVVSVHDFGQTADGYLFLAMELCVGRTLGEVLDRDGPVGLDRLVEMGVQLCDALEAAHRLRIVHRDLKPSNVMVLDEPSGRDRLKVLDFGIARTMDGRDPTITASREFVGSPGYVAPEVIAGEAADARADLYALGAILYELASGLPPFSGEVADAVIDAQVKGELRPLGGTLPAALGALVSRLLEPLPARRSQSASEVREQLLALRELAGPPGPLRLRAPRRSWRAPIAAGVVGAIVVGVVALGVIGGRLPGRSGGDLAPLPVEKAPVVAPSEPTSTLTPLPPTLTPPTLTPPTLTPPTLTPPTLTPPSTSDEEGVGAPPMRPVGSSPSPAARQRGRKEAKAKTAPRPGGVAPAEPSASGGSDQGRQVEDFIVP